MLHMSTEIENVAVLHLEDLYYAAKGHWYDRTRQVVREEAAANILRHKGNLSVAPAVRGVRHNTSLHPESLGLRSLKGHIQPSYRACSLETWGRR
jgi:hypothetical protein